MNSLIALKDFLLPGRFSRRVKCKPQKYRASQALFLLSLTSIFNYLQQNLLDKPIQHPGVIIWGNLSDIWQQLIISSNPFHRFWASGTLSRKLALLTTNNAVNHSAKNTTNDRGHPEKPKLRNRPITYKQSNTRTSRRIY